MVNFPEVYFQRVDLNKLQNLFQGKAISIVGVSVEPVRTLKPIVKPPACNLSVDYVVVFT